MGWFEGFPFTSKTDRAKRQREFEKRVVPFGAEAQRERQRATLRELFPGMDTTDLLFALFDAKDAFTKAENDDEEKVDPRAAARKRLKRLKWVDERKERILLRLIELERDIESLDEYPTARQVLDSLNDE